MRCPQCHSSDIKVVDSRTHEQSIRRRRECLNCGHRFNTYERIELRFPVVIKRDKSRENYERSKIVDGLRLACRKRPVPTMSIDAAADGIEHMIIQRFSEEVPSTELGELVLQKLQELDMVAYVRFASVYRQIDSPQDVMELLKPWLPTD